METNQQIQEILKEADSYGLQRDVIVAVEFELNLISRSLTDKELVELYERTFQEFLKSIKSE